MLQIAQVSQFHLIAMLCIWGLVFHETKAGFPVFLAITFQVICRFCPGQKGHSPDYTWTISAPKGKCQRHSKMAEVQNLEKVISI